MSENTQRIVAGHVLTREVIAEMLENNVKRLPDIEQKILMYGPIYLGGNAGLAGLVSNSLYRRALNVKQAAIRSALPNFMMPFVTTLTLYNATVASPLMSGDLNCPSCAMIRGAVVSVFGGGFYPILMALSVNLYLATLYKSAPMPETGNMLRFCVDLSRPIMRRMRAVLVLQAFFGTYMASRHFKTYIQLSEITFGSGGEDPTD